MARRLARHYDVTKAPADMRAAAGPYQDRFGIVFASLTDFSRPLLEKLHAHDGPADLPAGLRVASAQDRSVLDDLAELTAIANLPRQSVSDRTSYRDALLRIFGKLPVDAPGMASGEVLCVGPEREGRQLAQALGCLPIGRASTPQAKRIPYQGGILVGLGEVPATAYRHCMVVDGVVASGATVMALLHALPRSVERVLLLTAQSTAAGVWAIHRYAALLDVDCEVVAGHVSGVLNEAFYATDEQDPNRLVLGDVGDTISALC